MSLVRFQRRPMRTLLPPFPGMSAVDDVETRVRRMFDEGLLSFDADVFPQSIGWVPATDIVETADALTLTAELPGLERNDVDISIDDSMLTIRGEKSDERTVEDSKKHVVERAYGSFQRTFALPRTVDGSRITAEFGKGVLTVVMPKTTEAKARGRKVEITDKKK